jgi:patatin-like phospholipase/acyl hydrolase
VFGVDHYNLWHGYCVEFCVMSSQRFQILALDGGGIKGLFSAAVLAAIEEDLSVAIAEHFDLITGTSTGGIIALGLGLGMRPRQIVEFYVEHGPSIFRNPCGARNALQLARSKFSPAPLEFALRSPAAFGEKLLGDSAKRLVVPSYNLGDDDVYIFKTPHHERLRRDWRVPAWKVAMATAAAPTYFPAYCGVDRIRLVDGGVWANNPTLVGVIEAVSMLNIPLEQIRVFSLGTVDALAHRPAKLDRGGLWQWRTAAVDVIMRGQSLGVQKQAVHLLGENAVYRLDPKAPEGLFLLDKMAADGLIAKAAHESRHFAPTFESEFATHKADVFTPIYSRAKEGAST